MEIDNDTPMPDEEKEKPAPKQRKARTPRKVVEKKELPAAKLIEALKFVSKTQKAKGELCLQYCMFHSHWVVTHNGSITLGHPVEEDLLTYAHTMQLLAALEKAEDDLSIVQASETSIAVVSGDLRAVVPCLADAQAFVVPAPDSNDYPIPDAVAKAVAAVYKLCTVKAEDPEYAGVVNLAPNMAIAANNSMVVQYWHGINLPPNLYIPLEAAKILAGIKLQVKGFGFSEESLTFYYENGALVSIKLKKLEYPSVDKINALVSCEAEALKPLPKDFFKAVEGIKKIDKIGHIFLNGGSISSKFDAEGSTSYTMPDLPEEMGFSIALLLLAKPFAEKVFFDAEGSRVYFTKEQARGVLMGLNIAEVKANNISKPHEHSEFDDDIPF